jgi:hypothetical protein
MNIDQNEKYVEADTKARVRHFSFLGIWLVVGLILKWFVDERLKSAGAVDQAVSLGRATVWYWIVPMTMMLFILVQAAYLLWMGIKTFRGGIHPPTGTRMPFRTRVRVGNMAKLIGAGYLFAFAANLVLIALLIKLAIRLY